MKSDSVKRWRERFLHNCVGCHAVLKDIVVNIYVVGDKHNWNAVER